MEMTFDLLSGEQSLVIADLEPDIKYQVTVTTSSLKGMAQVPAPLEVSTFPNGETRDCHVTE